MSAQDHCDFSPQVLADLDGHRREEAYYDRLKQFHQENEDYDRKERLYHLGWQSIFAEEDAQAAELQGGLELSAQSRGLCASQSLELGWRELVRERPAAPAPPAPPAPRTAPIPAQPRARVGSSRAWGGAWAHLTLTGLGRPA